MCTELALRCATNAQYFLVTGTKQGHILFQFFVICLNTSHKIEIRNGLVFNNSIIKGKLLLNQLLFTHTRVQRVTILASNHHNIINETVGPAEEKKQHFQYFPHSQGMRLYSTFNLFVPFQLRATNL